MVLDEVASDLRRTLGATVIAADEPGQLRGLLVTAMQSPLWTEPAPVAVPRPSPVTEGSQIRASGWSLDPDGGRVRLAGAEVVLSPREARFLTCLMQHPGKPLTRDQIVRAVWGKGFPGTARTVDVLVYRLRRRLFDRPDCPVTVEAVHGVGYKLENKPNIGRLPGSA